MEPNTNIEEETVVVEDRVDEDSVNGFIPEEKVIYAIKNADNHITQLVSSVFITEEQLAVATPVATGDGDNYVHVGEFIRNVLGKELFDENGCANFYLAEIQVSLPDEPETTSFEMLERSQIDKEAEVARRPKPEVLPTMKEMVTTVAEMTSAVSMLSDAMVEVDNSSTETNTTVVALSDAMVEVDSKTTETQLTVEALSEALVEVDNRTNVADLALAERKTDIEIVMDAIVELSEAIAAIQTKLDIK